jgi:tRNA G18 (ribose-2'-O)-methylase SpoU
MNLPPNANVIDKYKWDRLTKWTTELIKEDLQKTAFPYAVLMENFAGDFNIGTVIRNANAFNAKEVFYLGMRHYDKRGTVGTHHYTAITHIRSVDELSALKERYTLVGIENSVSGAVSLGDFKWPSNPLLIIGEEGVGITPQTLALCDHCVYIPQYGSVRSLNAGVASGIVLNDFVTKHGRNNAITT